MKNPRIHVSFDPELHAIVQRLGRSTKQSASSVVRTLIEQQQDVLLQLADTLDHARELAGPLSEKMKLKLISGEKDAERLAGAARERLDQLQLDIDGAIADQRNTDAQKGK